MAGKESAPQRADVELAKGVKRKAVLVGAGAVVLGAIAPPLAAFMLEVAALQGLEWTGAEAYEGRFDKKEVEMKPQTEYDLVA